MIRFPLVSLSSSNSNNTNTSVWDKVSKDNSNSRLVVLMVLTHLVILTDKHHGGCDMYAYNAFVFFIKVCSSCLGFVLFVFK